MAASKPRKIEAVSEIRQFGWDHASLDRMFSTLDAHPLAKDMPPGDLSIAFVDDAASAVLHGNFFSDPTPTDVMTFPGDPGEGHAGDIAANIEIAVIAASGAGWSTSEELTLYLVHGWLHLAGFRDDTPQSRSSMRAAENELMAHLRANATLPEFTFPPRSQRITPRACWEQK